MSDHERELELLMAALRRQRAGEPVRPNAFLDAEFRRRYGNRRSPWRLRFLAAAAMVLMAAALAWISAGSRHGNAPVRAALAAGEESTAFFPLRAGSVLDPQEPANVVRIQLRRSEMRRFGLPVSPEWEAAQVQADVVVGQDGTARAVRFVHQIKSE